MKRLLMLALFLLILTGCGTKEKEFEMIITNKEGEIIRYGMLKSEAEEILGTGERADYTYKERYIYDDIILEFRHDKVVSISVYSSEWKFIGKLDELVVDVTKEEEFLELYTPTYFFDETNPRYALFLKEENGKLFLHPKVAKDYEQLTEFTAQFVLKFSFYERNNYKLAYFTFGDYEAEGY